MMKTAAALPTANLHRRTLLIAACSGAVASVLAWAPRPAHAQVASLNDAINKAGRQRMLSQRMAKFYLAALLPVDAAASAAEIAKARTEFVAANEVLRKAPEANDRIRQELQLADGQWVFFDAALQRMQTGNATGNTARLVSDVFVASENLLSSMDKVTGLYAALGG